MFLCCHYTTGYFPAQEKVSNGKQKVSIRKPRFFVEIEQPVFSAASACLPSWYRWPEGPEGVAFHSGDTLSVTAFAVTAPPKGEPRSGTPSACGSSPSGGAKRSGRQFPPAGEPCLSLYSVCINLPIVKIMFAKGASCWYTCKERVSLLLHRDYKEEYA